MKNFEMKHRVWLNSIVLMGFAIILACGCVGNSEVKVVKAHTTIDRTIIPVAVPSTSPEIEPYEISKFSEYGYGVWKYGEGLAYEKRTDIISPEIANTTVTNSARLLNFFAITDVHLTDKESPSQAVYFGIRENGIISAYSPAMIYSTHMLNAAIQTINDLDKVKKYDFGISLGDVANSGQYNELRWFIDVLDGKNINPDSGIKDDPIPGEGNDYQDEYKAVGLDKSIPWYATLGNHDHFWVGINSLSEYMRQSFTGSEIMKIGDIFKPDAINKDDFYVGTIDGKTPYGNPIVAGPVASSIHQLIPADSNRRFLSRNEWMNEFSNTSSNPIGHGFDKAAIDSGFACYSFEPKSNVPIKVIVLDDTQDNNDANVHGYGHATLDQKRYDWLVSELDKGQVENKLMIIASHVPIGVKMEGGLGAFIGWSSLAAVSESDLIAKLNTYPNLLLWIAGHRHLNTVTAFKSPDENRPELGFWEVETSSLREFPQQFRNFEIVRNSNNTISIFATNVDPEVEEGSLAAKSRSYAIAANQIFKIPNHLFPTGSVSYNVELIKQLGPEMQTIIQNFGTPLNN